MKRVKINKNWTLGIGISFLILLLISINLAIFSAQTFLQSLRIVYGSVYVLFLPGFVLSYLFFSETKKEDEKKKNAIDWIERIALSFALSIAIVPLIIFYLNLIGLKITALNTFFTILGILIISGSILKRKIIKKIIWRK